MTSPNVSQSETSPDQTPPVRKNWRRFVIILALVATLISAFAPGDEVTLEVVNADEEGGVVIADESGPFLEGALYNRRATLSGHLGLQGSLELGVARLIFGSAVARTPSVIGEQSVTTTCEGIGACDGPSGEDEVPVVRHIALFTLWGGVEIPLSQHFALLGTYHNSATSHEKSQSMNNQGFNLSLKLTL